MIIGVTGYPASGKDTVADYLASKGFTKVSMGDLIREEMQKWGLAIDRTSIHNFISEKRAQYGNDYLCTETLKRISGNGVIAGIRNTEEVKVFKEKLGDSFRLIAVETPLEVRFARAKERGRIGDDISFERFKREEDVERAKDSGSFEMDKVIEQVNFKINNNGTLEDLFAIIDDYIEKN